MSGRASAGPIKELALGVGAGVPVDISAEDAKRNLDDMSQIHYWLQLGLSVDLGQVDMAAIEALVRPNPLEQVGTFNATAISTFDVGVHFKETPKNERATAEVLISFMSDTAEPAIKGLVETGVAAATLRRYKLLRRSADGPIIAELGGGDNITLITTRWAQMYEMIRVQGRGQEGDLLTNGGANIFFIPDRDGVVWAVHCSWFPGDGWGVDAFPVAGSGTWGAGNHVFSR